MFIVNIQYVCTVRQYTFILQGEIGAPLFINTPLSGKVVIFYMALLRSAYSTART